MEELEAVFKCFEEREKVCMPNPEGSALLFLLSLTSPTIATLLKLKLSSTSLSPCFAFYFILSGFVAHYLGFSCSS